VTDRARIRDYMIRDMVTLTPETELLQAMNLLLEGGISGAPVIDAGGNLVGMLTQKDCLRAALNATYFQEWGRPVADYMSREVETLDADVDIVTATEIFLASPYRRFPVVDNGRLVGQISRSDLLRALISNWQ